ncbi:unnamed protein product [Amoebophrya sp. A120]|nr:unnamed protein product [Amoebophrya sp. A120]|eukprot:GSA120T00023928001.1
MLSLGASLDLLLQLRPFQLPNRLHFRFIFPVVIHLLLSFTAVADEVGDVLLQHLSHQYGTSKGLHPVHPDVELMMQHGAAAAAGSFGSSNPFISSTGQELRKPAGSKTLFADLNHFQPERGGFHGHDLFSPSGASSGGAGSPLPQIHLTEGEEGAAGEELRNPGGMTRKGLEHGQHQPQRHIVPRGGDQQAERTGNGMKTTHRAAAAQNQKMNQDAITELYHAYMRRDQYNPYDYVPFYYEHGGIQIGSAAEDPTKKIRSLHDPDQVFSGFKIWDIGADFRKFVERCGSDTLKQVYFQNILGLDHDGHLGKMINKKTNKQELPSRKPSKPYLSIVMIGASGKWRFKKWLGGRYPSLQYKMPTSTQQVVEQQAAPSSSSHVVNGKQINSVQDLQPIADHYYETLSTRKKIRKYFPDEAKTLFSNLYESFVLIPDVKQDEAAEAKPFGEFLASSIFEVLNAGKEERVRAAIEEANSNDFKKHSATNFVVRMELLERESVLLHRKIVEELGLQHDEVVNCYGRKLKTSTEDGDYNVDQQEENFELSFLESTMKFLKHEFVETSHAFNYVLQWCNLVGPPEVANGKHGAKPSLLPPEYQPVCPAMGKETLRMQNVCNRVRDPERGLKTSIFLKAPSQVVFCPGSWKEEGRIQA